MTDQPTRDTAHGRLWWALWDNYTDQQKTELIDAFAHELAEKQRQWLDAHGYDSECACGGCSACLATEYIDLIDPEAQQ